MKFKSAIIAVALVAGSAVGASANGTFCFGPTAGASLPMGDYGDAASTGWNAGANCTYRMNGGWGIGGDLAYHSWSGSDELNQAAELAFGTGSEISWSAVQITPNVSYHFPTASSVKPYAKAGVGMYSLKSKLTSPSGNDDVSKSKMGFNFGGGMDFSTSSSMTWGIDTAYHVISASDDFGTDINNVTFGIHMTFGGNK
jgi:opacity protein-like surface antigen